GHRARQVPRCPGLPHRAHPPHRVHAAAGRGARPGLVRSPGGRLPGPHPARRGLAGAGNAGQLPGQKSGGGGHRRRRDPGLAAGGVAAGQRHRAALLQAPLGGGAPQRALSALPVGADPPAGRRLLPRGHLGGALRHYPGARSTAVAMNARSALLTAATVLGLVLVFIGERLVGAGAGRVIADVLGVLAVAAATVLRGTRSARASPAPRARVERTFALLSTLAVLAILTWFVQSDAMAAAGGPELSRSAPRLATVLQIATALLASAAVVPLVLGELAYAAMARAPEVEVGRVEDAVGSGLALVAVLTTALSLGWVADVRDVSVDWSFFRPGRVSDSTRGVVRGFTEPVTVSLFYPPGSDVGALVGDYVRALAKESPLVRVEQLDAAVDLPRARALGVSANGAVVVSRGERKEAYQTGV